MSSTNQSPDRNTMPTAADRLINIFRPAGPASNYRLPLIFCVALPVFSMPEYLKGTNGEMLHPHDEGSTHAVHSLSDATRAIELGWAERHLLSGVHGVIPWGYVLIYAPRNDAEFEGWEEVVLAAVRFNAEASTGATSVTAPAA